MRFCSNIGMFCVFFYCVMAVSCTTLRENRDTQPENTINGVLNASLYTSDVYIGYSGRMLTRSMEIDYAKLHIAHQMAIRDRCVVDTGMIDLSEGDQDSLVMDSNFDYDDSHIDELIDYIEVIETYVFPGLAVVLARDNRKTVSANIVIPRLNTERPRWVHNPQWVREFPGMEDYSVGVGVAGKNTALFKGLRIADVNAAQAIAAEKNSFNRSFLYDYVNSRFVDIETGNAILTKAELYGFYILDRWLEPDGSACYSLGISLNDK